MTDRLLRAYVWQASGRTVLAARLAGQARLAGLGESGEGVISAAIAVLVMAFLGVLMWQLFGDTLRKANSNVNNRLDELK